MVVAYIMADFVRRKVTGVSIGYPTSPSHFKAISLEDSINHNILDIRNLKI